MIYKNILGNIFKTFRPRILSWALIDYGLRKRFERLRARFKNSMDC